MQANTQRPNAVNQRVKPPAMTGNAQGPRKQQMRPTAGIPGPGKGPNQQRPPKPQGQNQQQRPNQNQTTNPQNPTHSQKPMKPQVPGQSQQPSQQQSGQAHRPNQQQNQPQKPNQGPNRPQQQNQNQSNQRPQRPSHPQGTAPNLPPNNPPRPRPNQPPNTQIQNVNPAQPRPLFSKPNPHQQQILAKTGQSIMTSIIRNAARPTQGGGYGGNNYEGYDYGEGDMAFEADIYDNDGEYSEYCVDDGLDGNGFNEDDQDDGNFDQDGNPLNDLDQYDIENGEYGLSMEPDTYIEEGADNDGNCDENNLDQVDETVNYDDNTADQLNRDIGDYGPGDELLQENTDNVQQSTVALEESTNSTAVPAENPWNESWLTTTTTTTATNPAYQNLTSASVSGPMDFFDPFAPYDPGFGIKEDPSTATIQTEIVAQEQMVASIPGPAIAEVSGVPRDVSAVEGSMIMVQESDCPTRTSYSNGTYADGSPTSE
jgi:hypothetical protein